MFNDYLLQMHASVDMKNCVNGVHRLSQKVLIYSLIYISKKISASQH